MKVIFCAYDGENIINGINAWLIRLLPQLAQNGIDVSVAFITWAPEHRCTTIPTLRSKGIKYIVIPAPHYTERQVWWLLKYIDTEQPDVFVPGNMLPALHAARYLKTAAIPCIGILHNDDAEYDAILNDFSKDVDAIVAVSERLYSTVKRHTTDTPAYRIPYGAALPDAKATYAMGDPFNVTYVGRIVKEQKRIDLVTEAFCRAALALTNCSFHIYGSGPDVHLMNDVLTTYGNPPNVLVKGIINTDQMPQVMLNSQVIVLMSDYEGIPVALMEAMACGVVPICKKIDSGIPELVTNGITGLYIEHPTDILQICYDLQENAKLWQQLSNNCSNLIQERFSDKKNTSDWLQLLNTIAANKKRMVKTEIPYRVKLPPVNPVLAPNDKREPGLVEKATRKMRHLLKRMAK